MPTRYQAGKEKKGCLPRKLGLDCAAIQIPIGEENNFVGVVDVRRKAAAHKFRVHFLFQESEIFSSLPNMQLLVHSSTNVFLQIIGRITLTMKYQWFYIHFRFFGRSLHESRMSAAKSVSDWPALHVLEQVIEMQANYFEGQGGIERRVGPVPPELVEKSEKVTQGGTN